jgi:hypothetical protein
MATTTATRYIVRKGDTTGWEVVTTDGTHVADASNREQARAIKRELDAQDADEANAEAEVEGQDDADPIAAPDGLSAREDTPEDVAEWHAQMDEWAAQDAAEDAAVQAEVEAEEIEREAIAATVTEAQPEPEAPKPTHESVMARKLQEGYRIALRDVGAVRVTGVTKVRGQQKVLVRYRTDDDTQGERELWVNSRYRVIA